MGKNLSPFIPLEQLSKSGDCQIGFSFLSSHVLLFFHLLPPMRYKILHHQTSNKILKAIIFFNYKFWNIHPIFYKWRTLYKQVPDLEIPEVVIGRAHTIVIPTKKTQKVCKSIIVRSTMFRHHTTFYRAQRSIGNRAKVRLDLTKRRYIKDRKWVYKVKWRYCKVLRCRYQLPNEN